MNTQNNQTEQYLYYDTVGTCMRDDNAAMFSSYFMSGDRHDFATQFDGATSHVGVMADLRTLIFFIASAKCDALF